MELNSLSTRWGLGSRSSSSGRLAQPERKHLLHQSDEDEDEVATSTSRSDLSGKPFLSQKMHKAKKEDDDDDENILLLANCSRPPRPPPALYQCFEVDIVPGDTLTSLSLKYNLPVAELKRVNNILNDNQFYALKKIKILVKPDSLLTELLPDQRPGWSSSSSNSLLGSGHRQQNGWTFRQQCVSDEDQATSTATTATTAGTESSNAASSVNSESESADPEAANCLPLASSASRISSVVVTSPQSHSKNARKALSFLRHVDKDLERIKQKQERLLSSHSEPEPALQVSTIPSVSPASVQQATCTSTSGRVSVCGLVCIVIVMVAVVLILLIAKHETYELSLSHHHWTMKQQPLQSGNSQTS